MRLPTASKLELVSRCIGSCVLPNDRHESAYASRGTAVHAFLEACNRVGRDAALAAIEDEEIRSACDVIDLGRLPVDPSSWAAEVALAFDVRTGRARRLDPASARDYSSTTEDEVAGTADAVGLTKDAALVVDFKTGYAHLPPPEDHRQLRFLGLAAARACGRSAAVVELIRIREDGTAWRTSGELDVFSLAEVAEETRALVADVRRWRASDQEPPLVVGDHCARCPAVARCPAQGKMARSFVVPEPDIGDRLAALETSLTPEYAADVIGRIGAARAYLDKLEKVVENFAKFNGPVRLANGKLYGPVEEHRDSLDGEAVWHVIAAKYGEDVARDATEIKATKKKIYEALRKVVKETGAKLTHENRALLAELSGAGALKTKYWETVKAYAPKETKP